LASAAALGGVTNTPDIELAPRGVLHMGIEGIRQERPLPAVAA